MPKGCIIRLGGFLRRCCPPDWESIAIQLPISYRVRLNPNSEASPEGLIADLILSAACGCLKHPHFSCDSQMDPLLAYNSPRTATRPI
jgi:hypothetical protein